MTGERSTRRGFLQGQVGASIPSPAPRASSPPLTTERSSLLVSVRRRIMACEFEVQLAASREDDSMEHVFAALDLAEELEAQMTVYRSDGEVVRINRCAGREPVRVESRLFDLFRQAERLSHETSGAIDITSGPLSDAWGFSRREGRIPSEAAIAAAREQVGMHYVSLDEEAKTIAFRRSGVSVNLNSIGKGYALDRMAELLVLNSVGDYLLHGGKSSVLARGNQPGHVAADGSPACASHSEADPLRHAGWTVGLRHPLRPAERLAEFCLHDQSLSTSGSGTQFFIRGGRRYGHILDPRTGRPAEGLYSATVIAPTAAEADALSTAFYVMGPDKVEEYCAAHPEIGALLVAPTERDAEVRLFEFNLDDHRPPSDHGRSTSPAE
jgi:thiamine biosynthesis lipoprotein